MASPFVLPGAGAAYGRNPFGPAGPPAKPVARSAPAATPPAKPAAAAEPRRAKKIGVYAAKVVAGQISPGLVKRLQAEVKADARFQADLNAEIDRQTKVALAKQNAGKLEAVGRALDPGTTVVDAVHGVGQIGHAANQAVHGDIAGAAKNALFGGLSVAAVVPVGKLAKGAELGVGLAKGGRTAEQAAAHVDSTAAAARAAGFGRKPIPHVGPGELTAETGGELGAKIRAGLKGAPQARGVQRTLHSEERGKRAGFVAAALEKGGAAGHAAALGELKGELPSVPFGGLRSLSKPELDAALRHVQTHPDLQVFSKIRAGEALRLAATHGRVPTLGEERILRRAFGTERPPVPVGPGERTLKQKAFDTLNVPRSLMASADLSAPFRQGLVTMASHPKIFFGNFPTMLKAAGSEKHFQAAAHEIRARNTYPLMERAKLALTDIGEDTGGVSNLSRREEQFMSNYAERLPGVGRIVRGSDRAYTMFLNKTRADVFDQLAHDAAAQGLDLGDRHLVESIAGFVNSATGRGSLGAMQRHALTLNTLFFSPRLLASRLNFLNPVYYAKLDPFARKQALEAAAKTLGTLSTFLYLAKLGGAQVGVDPRSADFAKIRLGNTRIDILGGFQQPVRLAAQLASGEIVSSTTGKKERLSGGFAGSSRFDVLMRFLESKAAPVPSAAVDILKNETFTGGKPTVQGELAGHLIPLGVQDAYSMGHESGPVAALAGYLASSFGVGIQSYAAKPPKRRRGSSSNPFDMLDTGGSSGPSDTAGNPFDMLDTSGAGN